MGNYVDPATLQASGVATESDDSTAWDRYAEAVSRLFDRECEVADNFFAVAPSGGSETTKALRSTGTSFLEIGPHITGSITAFTVDGVSRLADGSYHEVGSFIVFDSSIPIENLVVSVTARFGFAAIPAEISKACEQQALFEWRRKDLAFTDLSGVPTAAVTADFCPLFAAVTKRYRGLYSPNNYFA